MGWVKKRVFGWIRENWDLFLLIVVAVGITVFFLWTVLRPLPVPPGY